MQLRSPTEFAKEKVLAVQEYTLLAVQAVSNLFRKPLYFADMVQQAEPAPVETEMLWAAMALALAGRMVQAAAEFRLLQRRGIRTTRQVISVLALRIKTSRA